MLAVSHGRLVCLSTPYGKHGFFHETWANGGPDWERIEVRASQCPRITTEWLEEERRALSESYYRQEYECSFEALEGLVYPDFARCVVPALPAGLREALPPSPLGGEGSGVRGDSAGHGGTRLIGGIDFGFRNPCAAVWGTVDRDGVLWLTGEHYARNKPLSYHAEHLPKSVRWYADPSGASEITELSCVGFAISKADNALRPGIAAVSARLEGGLLHVVEGRCPNLLREAGLYRYSPEEEDRRTETPVDDQNHALAALRYLISMLDARHMARLRKRSRQPDGTPEAQAQPKPQPRPWLSVFNEQLWDRRLW
ncbi:MAG TPA: hypothetical protein VG013_00755 [Gemmataceae bacterium]|jgi:hypothetical protein|nr:hypothetical protein [Gemmataceae bacterium]